MKRLMKFSLLIGTAVALAGGAQKPVTSPETALRQAVDQNPKDGGAHLALCAFFESAGKIKQAQTECREGIRYKANDVEGLQRLGRLSIALRDWPEAIRAFE